MSLYICLALVGRFSPTQSTNSNSIPSLVDKSDDLAVRNGVSRGSSDLSIVPGEGIHTYQKVRTEFVCGNEKLCEMGLQVLWLANHRGVLNNYIEHR